MSLSLSDLRGRVVLVHAFQMLCPGCVSHGVPQAERIHQAFPRDELVVVGLHTVFEHHQAMLPHALEAFLHEYRISHPIGVDRHLPGQTVPATMAAWGLRGTPSVVVVDHLGHVRLHEFGRVDDLQLGALLGRLVSDCSVPAGPGSSARRSLPDGST